MFGLFETGIEHLTLGNVVMYAIGIALIYLGIRKKLEPLLLLPIGFGIIATNLPLSELWNPGETGLSAGLLGIIYKYGILWVVIPPIIFLGIGAMVDFGPVLANPKTFLLGGAAMIGIYFSFLVSHALGFTLPEASAIGIIGGADGPATVYVASQMAPHIFGPVAMAAYTYMALVPIIQPPIMKALTTKRERAIYMKPQMRHVSQTEKIVFPIIACITIILIVPRSAPLMLMFMFGNLMKESGVVKRLADTASNELMNIAVIFLGLAIGASMPASIFFTSQSIGIFVLGLAAFCIGTASGVLFAKAMNLVLKEKINPLLGGAGVPAVPMSARVVQKLGLEANPHNHLLMHAIGPNVAGTVASAAAAGVFLGMVPF